MNRFYGPGGERNFIWTAVSYDQDGRHDIILTNRMTDVTESLQHWRLVYFQASSRDVISVNCQFPPMCRLGKTQDSSFSRTLTELKDTMTI